MSKLSQQVPAATMLAVGYVRSSTENRRTARSQTAMLTAWCEANGAELVLVEDVSRSGQSNNLDLVSRLLRAGNPSAGLPDIVIVTGLSRFSRDLAMCDAIVRGLNEAGTRVVEVSAASQ